MTTNSTDIRTILLDFQTGRRGQVQTMKLLHLDWYGDLLHLLGQYDINPPLGGMHASPGAVEFARDLIKSARHQSVSGG